VLPPEQALDVGEALQATGVFRAGSSARSIARMPARGMLADLVVLDRDLVTGSSEVGESAASSSQGPNLVMVELSFEAAAPTASITGT
jgi:hypothetical protein